MAKVTSLQEKADARSKEEAELEEAIDAVSGLFEDMDEPTRAVVLQELLENWCPECGSAQPENPEETCPCTDGDEDDDEDEDDEDGGDDGDPDAEDEDSDETTEGGVQ